MSWGSIPLFLFMWKRPWLLLLDASLVRSSWRTPRRRKSIGIVKQLKNLWLFNPTKAIYVIRQHTRSLKTVVKRQFFCQFIIVRNYYNGVFQKYCSCVLVRRKKQQTRQTSNKSMAYWVTGAIEKFAAPRHHEQGSGLGFFTILKTKNIFILSSLYY